MRGHRFSIPLVLGIFLLLHAIFAAELWLDLRHGAHGGSLADLWNSLDGSAAMARMSGTTISRAYNVLVSLVLTSIALAIPLTANMYTPKLIDIFIKDRLNIAVLTFFVLSSAQAIWSAQATWDQGALRDSGGLYPRTSLWLAFETITLGWSILIPYFYYVFRFLNPTHIIERVSALVTAQIDAIPREPDADFAPAQRALEQQIMHLGNVILRAVDRADRDVTLDAVHALRLVLERYLAERSQLPERWFLVDPALFVGLSRDAVRIISEEKIWVEQKHLHQLTLAYNASLAKMQDSISAISDANRQVAARARARGQMNVLRLCVRTFNTFLREAVKRKDVHAIFDVLHQYKEMANDLLEDRRHDDLVGEIGEHLKYYADFARASGLTFIYELASYDLEAVVERAHLRQAAPRRRLLEILLSFDAYADSARLVKAKLIAGGFFRERGLAGEEALVRARLAAVPEATLAQAAADLASTQNPIFWEVTDRQTNIDFVDAGRKAAIAALVAEMRGTR